MRADRKRLKKRVMMKNCHSKFTRYIIEMNECIAQSFGAFGVSATEITDFINPKRKLIIKDFHARLKKHAKKRFRYKRRETN